MKRREGRGREHVRSPSSLPSHRTTVFVRPSFFFPLPPLLHTFFFFSPLPLRSSLCYFFTRTILLPFVLLCLSLRDFSSSLLRPRSIQVHFSVSPPFYSLSLSVHSISFSLAFAPGHKPFPFVWHVLVLPSDRRNPRDCNGHLRLFYPGHCQHCFTRACPFLRNITIHDYIHTNHIERCQRRRLCPAFGKDEEEKEKEMERKRRREEKEEKKSASLPNPAFVSLRINRAVCA